MWGGGGGQYSMEGPTTTWQTMGVEKSSLK